MATPPGVSAPGKSRGGGSSTRLVGRGRGRAAGRVGRVTEGDAVVPVALVAVVGVLGTGELALGVLGVGAADGPGEGHAGGRVAAAVAGNGTGGRVVRSGGVGGGRERRTGEGQGADEHRGAGEG